MASEATSENLLKSSISPDELNTIETPSEDVTSEQIQPVVNGTSEKYEDKPDPETLDANVNSAEVSISGGSDTEASKAETKTQGDEKGHVRTTSTVKKFTSFKPVSVNKTFLAAKGATTATPSKLGEKGAAVSTTTQAGPSTSTAPRPRLVAKSGSGLRDSAPRNSASANGGKAGSAPDASAVWNKNRPAPPAEPKRFTDEELKQRYGIHLATRLQSDDPGKQANWADIDDDDDDWAPETIEWTDGTKITLPQADETPAPAPEPNPVAVKEAKIVEMPKSISPAPTQASASPTVKPSGLGTGRAGLILKGAAEKPTLVAKPPGPPTPVKSPWAPLPPVDKVAPIAIEIPHQQQQQPQQSRFSQRDPHGFQGMPPPPAKEIAADDFSRSSWREGSNTSRELYNSQSGRYEPVNDSRRGSTRNDARGHQPAVLQRPSPQDGPAEPSPAFQTHRASGQDGGYGRRRTSSNVSGGSGNFVRRMSRGHDMQPPHEMLNVRRGSLAAVSDSPSSPRNYSPSGQHQNQNQRGYQNQQWQQSRASPVISHPSPQSIHGQTVPPASNDAQAQAQAQASSAVYEDPIETQKKIMRQTRELAIKRRLEEEAKEEAARKERIRLKLEAMGPPPETKKKKDAPKEDKPSPTQIQAREEADPALSQSEMVPANDGSKVKSESAEPSIAADKRPSSEKTANPVLESRVGDTRQAPSTSNAQQTQENRPSQSWQNASTSSSDRFKPWSGASSQQSTSRNVWGPPTNDRTLGNGTFNPELSRIPDMHQGPHPGPIGPPNSVRGNSQSQQGHGREYGSRPAPIGPPNRQAISRQDQTRAAVANSGWGSLPDRIAQDDALLAQQQDAENARRRELREKGIEPEANTVIKDTWRPVDMNEDGTRGKLQGKVATVHDSSQAWKQQEESTTRGVFEEQDMARRNIVANHTQQFDAWRPPTMTASPPVRGSRFFPNNRDVRLEEQPALFDRPGSPSPPPPTMAGHPAYDGDTTHPHVLLPRPSPVVKLPPPPVLAPIGPPKPTSFAAAVQAPAVPVLNHVARQDLPPRGSQYQDIRRQEPTAGGWQERINSLIGRNNSPPKSHALAVDSSSKSALEVPHQQLVATVSLPSRGSESILDDGMIESKPAAEECFEEQEMGSLPIIKVPVSAPPSAWSLAPPQPKSLPRKFHVAQTTSAEAIHFPQQIANNNSTVTIRVPGQEEPRSVNIPVPRQRSNPRRGGSRGGNPRQSHPRGRGRDTSGGFPSPNLDNASAPSSPAPSRGGRGGRGYSATWNRHVATPVHT
ncbi:uncharacterized protein LY89DRAFT_661289 [Mollisia scopiformis]|uniref:Uncharacterized protein n=1 Tax=Mollisia scopiformis TaxID=149040 RepID=A0A132B3S2_MOLSC|nr:uncharacterized protein LY89DRAFT_661289 [Mollisia scopiformis]KUJ07058.1 hypothetical protein LY89DRAFT_661289 [Mollisia scopiformis]